jgi:hypothetical protein
LISAVQEVSVQPHALATLPKEKSARDYLDVLENRKVLGAGFKCYVTGLFSFNSEKRTRN